MIRLPVVLALFMAANLSGSTNGAEYKVGEHDSTVTREDAF